MVRRQFLWLDPRGAGCYFPAAGNINAAAGGKGTLALWQWPLWRHESLHAFWRLEVDAGNYLRQANGRALQLCSGGVTRTVDVSRLTSEFKWDHLVYAWDFTTPGAGVLRAYWDGVEQGTAVTDANAPAGVPSGLRLGSGVEAGPREAYQIYSLAVWDDVMSQGQVAALYAEGYRRRVRESDGNGELTLYASYDGRYDADVAGGDGSFGADGAPDRYCLVDDGAREQGLKRFLLGMPRHDLSEDDRVPLGASCPLTVDFGTMDHVVDTNEANHSRLQVLPGYSGDRRVGAALPGRPVLDGTGVAPPGTLRWRIHLPNDDNPAGRTIRVGPVDYVHHPTRANDVFDQWGSGRRFTVVADPGNSPTQVKTDLDGRFDSGHFAGADVTFLGGNCTGRRLRATGYDAGTKVLTLESALVETPSAGSGGVVDHRARLQGCRSWGSATHGQRIPEQNVDALLWEFHAGSRYFTELEWQYMGPNTGDLNTPNFLRYERGRTVLMDGASSSAWDWSAAFGRPAKWDDPTLGCLMLLERLEVGGPQTYQLLRRNSQGVGPDYADNFMVRGAGGDSTKVWRKRGVTRKKTRPQKAQDPAQVRVDLTAAGTWRQGVGSTPIPVLYDEERQRLVALLVGVGSDGVSRLGYVEGHWDQGTGRIKWEDEAAPAGRQNPFLRLSELRPGRERDGQLSTSRPEAVLQNPDGKWCLVYTAQTSHPDHFMGYLLYGASDRWSFDPQEHWWEGNPLVPPVGGTDRVAPEMHGYGAWANRDADWKVLVNPEARDASRRFWGVARGKSVNHRSSHYAADLRPVVGVRGSDLRSMRPLPHGNVLSPLAGPLVHACDGAVLGQADCLGLYTDTAIAFTSGVFCYVSEDGVHFQEFAHHSEWIPHAELPGEPNRLYPGKPFRLGDRRVYYYYAGSFTNYAWVRLEGEACYELDQGQTAGFLETPLIARPPEGWGELLLNVAPGGGAVTVEVLDGATEEVLDGFSVGEFEGAPDSVEHLAQWAGKGLAQAGVETIRLRFGLTRQSGDGETPRVYAWRIREQEVLPPRASGLRVDGKAAPTGVARPRPELSWEYEDPRGLAQGGFHVRVSTTREKLLEGEGDVWDSGPVAGTETDVTFAGATLESNKVYYWAVRVMNAEGRWSEEW